MTNEYETVPKKVLKFYNDRVASKNYIKELKNGFDTKYLSHETFEENTFPIKKFSV